MNKVKDILILLVLFLLSILLIYLGVIMVNQGYLLFPVIEAYFWWVASLAPFIASISGMRFIIEEIVRLYR